MQITKEILSSLADKAERDSVYPDPRWPPSIYYRFLKFLAEYMKPKLSVVAGVCGGGCCLHLCLGHKEGLVIGVDFAWDHAENILHILDNHPSFHFHLSDSTAAAPMLYDLYGEIDILFLDTDHTYEKTLAEFNAYKNFLSKDAVVCFDDLFRPGMQEAWDKIPGEKVRLDQLHDGQYPEGGGWGCAWSIPE